MHSNEDNLVGSAPKFSTQILSSFIYIILILIVCSFAIWLGQRQFQPPEVKVDNTNAQHFSAERAIKHLKKIAIEPRPIGAPEHDRVRDYLVSELKSLGVSPEVQLETENLTIWGKPYEGKVENIVARIPGKDSSGTIMITSHYDTDSHSPGAADAGSGVVAILETARALMESPQLKNDVVILITDGEEIGLLGAQAFANSHPWAKDIDIVLNFEARGSGGPSVLFETNEKNERLVKEFIEGVPNPVAHSFINELYKTMPNDTDFSVYKPSGVYGLNFAFFEDIYSYHTHEDSVENLDKKSLQHHGDNMLGLVQRLGNIELASRQDSSVLFFNAIGKKVVTYKEKLVIPIMLIAIIMYALIGVIGIKQTRFTLFGIGAGFFLFLLIGIISYFLGNYLWSLIGSMKGWTPWLIRVYPEISTPIFMSISFIIVSLISAIYGIFFKKVTLENLTMGSLLGWLILVCITSLLYKGTSYVFVWPFMFGLLGIGGSLYLDRKHMVAEKVFYLLIIVPILVLLGPIIYLIYVLLTVDNIGILMICVSSVFTFMIPLLGQMKGKLSIVFPIIFLLAGFVILSTSYIKVGL